MLVPILYPMISFDFCLPTLVSAAELPIRNVTPRKLIAFIPHSFCLLWSWFGWMVFIHDLSLDGQSIVHWVIAYIVNHVYNLKLLVRKYIAKPDGQMPRPTVLCGISLFWVGYSSQYEIHISSLIPGPVYIYTEYGLRFIRLGQPLETYLILHRMSFDNHI